LRPPKKHWLYLDAAEDIRDRNTARGGWFYPDALKTDDP